VLLRIPRNISRQGDASTRKSILLVSSVLLIAVGTVPAWSQQVNGNPPPHTTDLALQNLNQVAASVGDLKAILIKDVGLMVELKRWVAKDATDHGQIVGETELSDYAIFDRLTTDVEFRSVATSLVQKYGYLVPKLNPESDLAKDQELLRAERTKWLAQAEEQDRIQAGQRPGQNLQKTSTCRPQDSDRDCAPIAPASPMQNLFPGRTIESTPPLNPPLDQNAPILPEGLGSPLLRTQLMQTGASGSDLSQSRQLSPTSSLGSGNSFSSATNPFASNRDNNFGSLSAGDSDSNSNRQIAGMFSGANGLSTDSGDGLLRAFGLGSGIGMGAGSDLGAGLVSGEGALSNYYSQPGGGASLLVPMEPNRRYPQRNTFQPPEIIRRPGPYENVPSLYDMYVQTVARPSTPRRFGTEIFENGTRDQQLIPMDLPAGPDYVVGPGDGLSIDLWGGVSQRLVRTVDRGGQITLPEAGPIEVNGKTLAAVQEDVQKVLRGQYRDVSVGVSLSRLRTIRVYEVGDVSNPGAYDISSLSTPLNALFVAGGPSTRGSLRILNHYRGKQLVQAVDVYDLLLRGVKADIERLENGDTVQVPPIGPEVTIEGMVRRPAIYELRDEKNLGSVLELAGGLLPAAALNHIEVQRLVAHEKQTMLSVDIPENADSAEITKRLEAFEIRDGDRIRIYPIAPYNPDAIYLEGHVARPGRYSYHEGMRVTDLVAGYKDILPEPAQQYAEIIRLNPPDFRPSVESFSLAAALADPGKAPALHPMDTVHIFSRFDFEPAPNVAVMGDVRVPGTYQTSGQIHLADAVHLAGGLTPDAQTGDAQVFRYLPDGKFKIFSVNLGQALAGDAVENVVLEPRDRLLIHRNPDAVQQSSVYIEGEVGKPGRYPLTTNMRVADLIRVGGGLKPSANAEAADLTEYEWSNNNQLQGQHAEIAIADALAGESRANHALRNGDVLTIRQLPGWNDLGAYITLKGEVKNPGVYGIRPGEKLSSVVERAGGFQPNAYAYGAIFQRIQVRDLQMKEQETLLARARSVQSNIQMMPENTPAEKQAKQTALEQYRTTIEELSANPPIGRVSLGISTSTPRWKNTSADIEVRGGDTLIIPKKPSYILVTGQVFNPTAIGYRPGKSAAWYLSQAGGATLLGDKKAAFVIRANGSVVSSKTSLWSGSSFGAALQPGDSVVVPEKAIGGPRDWNVIFSAAQVASSIASTVFIALHY
jgi:polysaccharide export outer membrane protein